MLEAKQNWEVAMRRKIASEAAALEAEEPIYSVPHEAVNLQANDVSNTSFPCSTC